nr:MAG TPA: hypothetical protein [Caudoviricetes sp.]
MKRLRDAPTPRSPQKKITAIREASNQKLLS